MPKKQKKSGKEQLTIIRELFERNRRRAEKAKREFEKRPKQTVVYVKHDSRNGFYNVYSRTFPEGTTPEALGSYTHAHGSISALVSQDKTQYAVIFNRRSQEPGRCPSYQSELLKSGRIGSREINELLRVNAGDFAEGLAAKLGGKYSGCSEEIIMGLRESERVNTTYPIRKISFVPAQ